jgi:hypothetical protein
VLKFPLNQLKVFISYCQLLVFCADKSFIDILEAYQISHISDRTLLFSIWHDSNYLTLDKLSLSDWRNIEYILFKTHGWSNTQHEKFKSV